MDKIEWINDRVDKVPIRNWFYQVMCFLSFRMRRKFTYKELYIILCNVNKKDETDMKSVQENAFIQINNIHNYLTNGDDK